MSIVVRLFHLCVCTCAGMVALEGWSEARVLGVHHETPSHSRKHHIVWRELVSVLGFYVERLG